MKKTVILNVCALVLGYFISVAIADAKDMKYVYCSPKEEINKVLQEGKFAVLYRGEGLENTYVETWINGQQSITISYEKPKDNKAENIKSVCVNAMSDKTMFNQDTVETLYKALDKASPSL